MSPPCCSRTDSVATSALTGSYHFACYLYDSSHKVRIRKYVRNPLATP